MIGQACYTVRMGIGLGNGECTAQMPCGRCSYDGLCGYDDNIEFHCDYCEHRFVCFTNNVKDACKILRKLLP